MVSSAFKPAVNRFIAPIARAAIKVGITPNAVTLIGTIGAIASAAYFYPRGELFLGTLAIIVFALSDLFDGAIARISSTGPSAWGGFLDSTCDRLTDSAIVGSLIVFSLLDENGLELVLVGALVAGSLVPYIRAKAESYGIACTVGVAERTERLILLLTAAGFHGLGVPYIFAVGVWLLFILSTITAMQRIWVVRRGLKAI
jgi:CDP-diacylglycerol--glycerol-3-phosphate 3-phosphatidyltransferase